MTLRLIICLMCFSTGLFSKAARTNERTFESNAITLTAHPAPDLQACDTSTNGSQTAPFDLTFNSNIIISGQSGATVSYHLNLTDAQTGTAAIPSPNSYTNTTNPQTIYARIQDGSGNFDTTSFDLFVNPLPNVSPVTQLTACDTNQHDGYTTFQLSNSISQITVNDPDLSVTFHVTNSDAHNNTNSLPLTYGNTVAYNQTLYVRVENNNTGCFVIVSLDLIVQAIPAAFVPDPLTICDVNNDGFGSFTLTNADNQITGGAANVDVTYHLTQADAYNGVNPLPNHYFNSIPYSQTLHVRVEDTNTGCFNTVELLLIVHPLPSPASPTPLEVCDENNDGFSQFDLNIKIPEIINGEPNIVVTFHENLSDAQYGNYALSSPYSNIIPSLQTIYVRAEDTNTGCFVILTLDLIVHPSPIVPANIDPIIVCSEDINTFFDLTTREPEIYGSQNPSDYILWYYATLSDAENNTNPIANPSAYFNSNNPETIYIRLETHGTSGCYTTGSFELIVAQLYIAQAPDDIFIDEQDGDGIAVFDLTENEPQMLGTQNANDIVISYFISQADADTNSNAISNPQQFVNTANPQTIFVRMQQNLTTSCFLITSFEIETDETLNNHTPDALQITLYPNPVNSDLHLTTAGAIEKLEVFTINGQRLHLPINHLDNNGKRIDFSGLVTGVYLVKITTQQGMVIKRVIKK